MAAVDWPSVASSAIIATLGTAWFVYVLKGLKSLAPTLRYALYAAIWAAYFVLVMMFIARSGAA